MNDLLDAISEFCQRFDAWIIEQPESVQLSAGLAFGSEYVDLHDLVQKLNAERAAAANERDGER